MSSEQFESLEYEFNSITTALSKKINAQLPNYSGEQRKACIRSAQKDLERGDDLLSDMDVELRGAPSQYRTKMSARLRGYQAELAKFKKDLELASAAPSGAAAGRAELLAGGRDPSSSYQAHSDDQRQRLLDNTKRMDETGDRLRNAQRLGEESEAIGTGVLAELGTQRETIIRAGQKVSGMDANLGKSRRILNAMARRVITNKLVMWCIILLLIIILGITIFLKLRK